MSFVDVGPSQTECMLPHAGSAYMACLDKFLPYKWSVSVTTGLLSVNQVKVPAGWPWPLW
jgi:hypothetical protein